MFTGIIEAEGIIQQIEKEGENIHFIVKSALAHSLKVDQSVSHNGVCLTVVKVNGDIYTVTAIQETLSKSALGSLQQGDYINLERSVKADQLLDGHIVQGHVDATGICKEITAAEGSWYYTISYPGKFAHLLVPKGSISVNGVSLTLIDPTNDFFQVAIIPYTYEHTNFRNLKKGDEVNLEFDIIGKYLTRYLEVYKDHLPSQQ